MSQTGLIDEQALRELIPRFYARVRTDPLIGPVFGEAVEDWPGHLTKLVDFWSSVMLRGGRYHGNPMAAHFALRDRLSPPMFQRWLVLWKETAAQTVSPAAAARLGETAERIAASLQTALALKPVTPDQSRA